MTTLNDIHTYDATWRKILQNKGYVTVYFNLEYEPVNDKVSISMWWCNTELYAPATHLPIDMRACGRSEFGTLLERIDEFVRNQPLESEERDSKLIEEFARIKERLAASRFADLFEAEVKANQLDIRPRMWDTKRLGITACPVIMSTCQTRGNKCYGIRHQHVAGSAPQSTR